MSSVRILVVDDTPLFIQVVSDLFKNQAGFDVVGSARNGREALTRIHLLKPDLIILDVEMPVMNGWETLEAIRLSYPELVVILFSSLDQDGESFASKAVELGAKDFVSKPKNIDSQQAAWQHLKDNLLASVKLHASQM